jgi:hypothetical protein
VWLLERHIQRFEHRLSVWLAKHAELAHIADLVERRLAATEDRDR